MRRIGCVSFLNSKPLIDGLEDGIDPQVNFTVPSQLLAALEAGDVDVALCPVIDYQRSRVPLMIVPVGGIGSAATTLTVRLYSQTPLPDIREVHADTDSHTSVALLRVLLAERYQVKPAIIDYAAGKHRPGSGNGDSDTPTWPPAMLLIGDKVVTDSPPAVRYPHQLDLGQAWRDLTGLPFVFAVWMARADADLGELPDVLRETRLANARRLPQIVARHAAAHGWPSDLALQYFGHWLQYDIGPEQLKAIAHFHALAHRHGLIDELRPQRLYR